MINFSKANDMQDKENNRKLSYSKNIIGYTNVLKRQINKEKHCFKLLKVR